MAQTVAVVRGNLHKDASGTTDFEESGFGTPSAAIIVVCNANTSSNPATHGMLSIGFWDGTNQRVHAAVVKDNEDTSTATRRTDDDLGVVIGGSLNSDYSISNAPGGNGIRLTLDVDNTELNRYATVLLLKGVSASLTTFTPDSSEDGIQASANLGFSPKIIFFTTVGGSSTDGTANNAYLSFGFAESGGEHRVWMQGHEDNVDVIDCNSAFYTNRCVGQIGVDGVLDWTGEITTWGATSFTMTSRDGAPGSDIIHALALGGDVSFDVGTLTTHTAVETDAETTTVEPEALLLLASTMSATGIATDSESEGVCIGMSNGTNDYTHSSTVEDNADTTNAESAASASAVIDLYNSASGSTSAVAVADVSSFNATDFTLNWTTVDAGTPRKGWWVVFGEESESGLGMPIAMYHRLRQAGI